MATLKKTIQGFLRTFKHLTKNFQGLQATLVEIVEKGNTSFYSMKHILHCTQAKVGTFSQLIAN